MTKLKELTIFPAFNNPPLIVAGMVFGICLIFGLFLLFSHTIVYDYSGVPYIAWPWALPCFLLLALYNNKLVRAGDALKVSWRLGPITLKNNSYQLNSLAWVPYGNKQKYLSLHDGKGKVLVASSQTAKHISVLIS